MDKNNLWNKILDKIKEEISSANFRTWFGQTTLNSISENQLVINVPSAFIKENLTTKYLDNIRKTAQEIAGHPLMISFTIVTSQESSFEKVSEIESSFTPQHFTPPSSGLNPKYTLENFVVGLSNNLAYAAAQAVVQNPGISYNPLFIYGGTGVGKTHLMLGIGNALLQKNPQLKIIYCSSEKFTNDFIQSIQTKKTGDFRNKYRQCNLLLIDDIQFISGRDSTQEEFFHTFNELHSRNTQIVLTSDRTPDQMQDLELRLRSRFQGGLMVDIQSPDFDTRVAILRAKCAEKGESLPEEAVTTIAEFTATNARELEGKLIQIIQMSKLSKEPLTQDMIRRLLGKADPASVRLDYKKVLSSVNSYFGIKMPELTGPRRKKEFVLPRHLAMYLLYEDCKLPYERIGDLLGGRDHTTILHGVEKIRSSINRDQEIQKILIEIKNNIGTL